MANKRSVPPMKFRPSLFWDVDPKTIDLKKNAGYVIERILEHGTDPEVRWLWRTYSRARIYDVVTRRRGIHPRTRVLWQAITKV